jgi:hypothetical protein
MRTKTGRSRWLAHKKWGNRRRCDHGAARSNKRPVESGELILWWGVLLDLLKRGEAWRSEPSTVVAKKKENRTGENSPLMKETTGEGVVWTLGSP